MMNTSELRTKSDHELESMADEAAGRQLQLRRTAAAKVRSVLAGIGHRPEGTDWSLTAYVDPSRRIGFVEIAFGVAEITDQTLTADEIEALTVPDQAEGPQVSGAVAWSSPDVGEGRVASAPDGWTQLVMDLRRPPYSDEIEATDVEHHVCAWGLQTCYGRPGEPGYDGLRGEQSVDPRRGASGHAKKAMESIGQQWLRDVCLHLAGIAGVGEEVSEALKGGVGDAIEATGAYRRKPGGFSPESAINAAFGFYGNDTIGELLRDWGFTRVAREAGDRERMVGHRWYDLAGHLIESILRRDLLSLSEQLHSQLLGPAADTPPSERHKSPYWRVNVRIIPPLLVPLGKAIIEEYLREFEPTARDARTTMYGTLYMAHGGPVLFGGR